MRFQTSDTHNEYFINNGGAYVANKFFLENINKHLSNLNYKVYVAPEYLINMNNTSDVITEIDDRFFFSYKDTHGFTVNKENLSQYLDLVINNNPNYEPKIFSSNKELKKIFTSNIDNHKFNFVNVNKEIVNSMPNFFKMNTSLDFIIKKMNFSKAQLMISALAILFLIISPNYLIQKNVQNTKFYNEATFDIFNSINSDVKRVVAPRNQIDQIIKMIQEKINESMYLVHNFLNEDEEN